jgi:DNA-directed RNA polymerase specialized sigma24 family protein
VRLMNSPDRIVDALTSREPTPEFATQFIEICEVLFDGLPDPMLRQIGWLRLEGYADHEIASQLNCSRRTVQRRLEIIRRRWSDFFSD